MMEYWITAGGLLRFFEGMPYLASPEHVGIRLRRIRPAPDNTLRMPEIAVKAVVSLLVHRGRGYGG